jgi:hypothetical protein
MDESKFIGIVRTVCEDIMVPAVAEDVTNRIHKDMQRNIEFYVKKIYNEQVVATNEALTKSLTDVISLLAERQIVNG